MTLLVGDPPAREPAWRGARSLRGAAASHGLEFESWTHHPNATLSAARLRAWLKAMPEGVLRLKGLVATDEMPWAEIQFSGRHGSLRAALAPPPGGEAAIVAIGLRRRLPAATLAAAIDACSGVAET